MTPPLVSIIIPAYKGADTLGRAVLSALEQTYPHLEVIVVNDATPPPDRTPDVIAQFTDRRLKYLVHEKNKGLPGARNTGVRAAAGSYIALLDQDDYFHPEKLASHVAFLESHPEYGASYNARFELNHSADTIRTIDRPPAEVTLHDLVLGYPYAPSDLVLRKEWPFRIGLFDERYIFAGEDMNMNCRLAMAGCRFGRVNRVLNYRSHHSNRRIRDLAGNLAITLETLEQILADPTCPESVRALRAQAMSNNYLVYACYALLQGEAEFGRECVRNAVGLTPQILHGNPCELIKQLLLYSTFDDSLDHPELLNRMLVQLSDLYPFLADQFGPVVALGYLWRGTRAMLWDRNQEGVEYFRSAARWGAQPDEAFLRLVVHQLIDIEIEFGRPEADRRFTQLSTGLLMAGSPAHLRWIRACWSTNRGFDHYRSSRPIEASREMARGIRYDPSLLFNRGVLSVLARSFPHLLLARNQKLTR